MTMEAKTYNSKGKSEVKKYKMISNTLGHLFNFCTDNVEKYMNEYKDYHGYTVNEYTYEEVK